MEELRNSAFRNKYVSDICNEKLGVSIEAEDIKFIDEGAMNFVYMVNTSKGIFYFKQALKKAKDHTRIGADLASIPHLRIRYEKNVIDIIHGLLPKEIEMPEILSYDSENNILFLKDVSGDGGVLLQNALLKGDFNEKVASNIGKFLGISHKKTYDGKNVIRGDLEEDRRNWEIFLNMRTRGIASIGDIPKDAAAELSRLFDNALKNHTYDVLINMDCCPKNIFQRQDDSIGVIDFELASGVGDPAYDIGFALGHHFLFSALNGVSDSSVATMDSMFDSYLSEIECLDLKDTPERIIKYAGAILPYRVSGSSPAKYIPENMRVDLIGMGSKVITSNCADIDSVVRILRG